MVESFFGYMIEADGVPVSECTTPESDKPPSHCTDLCTLVYIDPAGDHCTLVYVDPRVILHYVEWPLLEGGKFSLCP